MPDDDINALDAYESNQLRQWQWTSGDFSRGESVIEEVRD